MPCIQPYGAMRLLARMARSVGGRANHSHDSFSAVRSCTRYNNCAGGHVGVGGRPAGGGGCPGAAQPQRAPDRHGVVGPDYCGVAVGAETVTLPSLTTGSVGNFNGVVLADSPAGFAAGQLSALDTYESTDRVRQIDGYTYPIPAQGITAVSGASTTLDNTTATLTAAGLAGLPGLKGTVPFDTGTYGVPASVVAGTIGAAFTLSLIH